MVTWDLNPREIPDFLNATIASFLTERGDCRWVVVGSLLNPTEIQTYVFSSSRLPPSEKDKTKKQNKKSFCSMSLGFKSKFTVSKTSADVSETSHFPNRRWNHPMKTRCKATNQHSESLLDRSVVADRLLCIAAKACRFKYCWILLYPCE